jgi:hypothetical protein
MSNDVVRALIINNKRLSPDSFYDVNVASQLQFVTSQGLLTVERVRDKENYISVGGVDYLSMLAEQELLT